MVEKGADLEARNNWGNTPLHIACLNGKASVCNVLIDCGAAIDAMNYRGQVGAAQCL